MRASPFVAAVICAFILAAPGVIPAQTGDGMFKNVESEEEYQDLLGILDAALKNPINLTEADPETMASLPYISPWLAERIVELRRAGMLGSLDDLTEIDGVTSEIVDLLAPFVVVERPKKAIRVKGTSRLRFISSPPTSSIEANKTYFTLRVSYSDFGLGFTAEKDKYETQVNDFQSVYVEKSWPAVYLAAGNYFLNSGYGLVFSGPYGYSPSTIGPFRFSRRVFGVKAYTSTAENFALGGAAVAFRTGGFEICAALSRTHLDARVDEHGVVQSIRTTGLHVSASEKQGKDRLREDLAGLALRYDGDRWRAGASISLARFDRDFEPEAFPWLEGNTNHLAGADLSYVGDGFGLFGEAGLSRAGGLALLGGVAFERRSMDLLALGRKYPRTFFSLHSRPFSAYSRATSGEEGLFLRLTLKPAARTVIAISNDIHRKDLGLGTGMTPSGSETLFEIGTGFGRFRVEVSEKITDSEDPPDHADDVTAEQARYRTRADLEYKPRSSLWLRLRLEYMRSRKEAGPETDKYSSDLMRLDIRLLPASRITVKAGFHVFRIEDFSARLYQYESGLPYYPSLEMLKSDGWRWYLIGVFNFGRVGSATLKYGVTMYESDDDREDLRFDYGVRF